MVGAKFKARQSARRPIWVSAGVGSAYRESKRRSLSSIHLEVVGEVLFVHYHLQYRRFCGPKPECTILPREERCHLINIPSHSFTYVIGVIFRRMNDTEFWWASSVRWSQTAPHPEPTFDMFISGFYLSIVYIATSVEGWFCYFPSFFNSCPTEWTFL